MKLTMAYIVWSVIYAFMRLELAGEKNYDWIDIAKESLNEQWHMWYIPMMLSIYILVPLLRVFTAHAERKHYIYMIWLMIFAMSLNTLYLFNEDYSYIYSNSINIIIDKTATTTICQYPFYCILGYYLYTYRPTKKTRMIIYFLGAVGILLTYYLTEFFYIKTGNVNPDKLQGKFTIGIFAKNTAIFLFVITVFSNIRLPHWIKKFVSKLSAATLFIYLVHILILVIFIENEFLFSDGSITFGAACIYAILIYCIGFLFSLLFLQFIPWVKMRNVVIDTVWPKRTIWTGGRKKK